MENPIRFFINFSSSDLGNSREIMAALKGQDLDFWDYSDIIQSIEIAEHIDAHLIKEIDACTHMILVISKSSLNTDIGRFCRFEFEYARKRKSQIAIQFIPVLLFKRGTIKFITPYDVFENDFYHELDNTPESIVSFTIKICQKIGKVYIPPIEAHPNLPFWKFFREEVEEMAHSNKKHVDIMMILGKFNEHYKRSNIEQALKEISFFLQSCAYYIPGYRLFYPCIVKAVCETELKMYDAAMISYEEAKAIHPENQDVVGGIGTVFFKVGQYDKAKECFEQIIHYPKNKNVTNAMINLIITKLAMEEAISAKDVEFLFHVDISGYSKDLQTTILNARGIHLRVQKDYPALEKLCWEIKRADLHDTITIRLQQLSYLNREMDDGKEVIRSAIKEADHNPRLDKSALINYLKDEVE